jgi:hypothetical protein
MARTRWLVITALVVASSAEAVIVGGGGFRTSECVSVFDAPANYPAPPRTARSVDCIDGDTSCDADGVRNAQCTFDIRLCVNSTAIAGCTPNRADSLTIDHALDNGDRRFDPEFQSLQQRANLLGFPDVTSLDRCTLSSGITVRLRPPAQAGARWFKSQKVVTLTARGLASGRLVADRDRIKFTCRPEGNALYGPRDLYAGTFDRIAQQLFATTCAVSGCHDSETHEHDLILHPGGAYSQLVNVTPVTPAAAGDGLKRVLPGDPDMSLLYRKVTGDLPSGYGAQMPFGGAPVSNAMVDIIRLWILDGAPGGGWVDGTDQ